MAEMLAVAPGPLEEMTKRIFIGAGAPEDIAAHTAEHLIKANLSGHDSHGVIRVPAYLRQIENGVLDPAARPEVVREWPGTALVDANHAFGQVAASYALDVAITKAETQGAGAVALRRSNHIGRLGHYSEAAAARGYVAMVIYGNAGPSAGSSAPFGGTTRHLGTNPWSFGLPARETNPVIVDFATTVVAEGKIQVARAKHVPLPPGAIVDKEGKPSTNAEDYYNGGMILSMGGHKGYGMSLYAAMLGASLTNDEPPTEGRGAGIFISVVNPRAFTGEEAFYGTIDALAKGVKAVPAAPGFSEVLLPGEPEAKSRAERQQGGVPIAPDTWDLLVKACQRFSVPVPETETVHV
jgi:LDH2 family malate/lactate/ureidoglycolate dehydrogenase